MRSCWVALIITTAFAGPLAVEPSESVTFGLALTRQRPRALADAVDAVARVSSPRYRQYLSDDEIAAHSCRQVEDDIYV